MSEADTQFILTLIRSEAGRVNQQEIASMFNAGGIAEAPERWVAKIGHGQLSPNLRKQAVDFTHAITKASNAAVKALEHGSDKDSESPGKRYMHTATNPENHHKIGTDDDPSSPNAKWHDIQTGRPL